MNRDPFASRLNLQRSRGAALLIVLGFLALIAIILVAYLNSVQTELTTAKSQQSSVTVQQLAATALNIVTGQIRDGTRSTKERRDPGDTTPIEPGSRLAWSSQPGMIRTWDDTGRGWRAFKLYSSPEMVVDISTTPYRTGARLAAEVPADWPGKAALFTDLNSPVLVEDKAGGIARDGRTFRASYPILDPLALGHVTGFEIKNAPGFSGGTVDETYDPTNVGGNKTGNPAPMPVAWIYVLKDGTLTVPTGVRDGGRTAHWTGADPAVTPSEANPIVGRVAFWADDETCKLNVNTSSEPTAWDTPRAMCLQDLNYGKFQPAFAEYQRFPGHPFMTALSPALFQDFSKLPEAEQVAKKLELYKLIPRIEPGGTNAGTTAGTAAANQVTLDDKRLFANVDEFLFDAPMKSGDPARPDNKVIDPVQLRRSRFFLTANSRAPEVNVFGQPRISLWPVHTDATTRTAFDKLASFCSTIGGSGSGQDQPYYFQRQNADSPTEDWSMIARNRELYGYLQTLTGQKIPGFVGSFVKKWGPAERDQVLTEIFDYVRCVNLCDPTTGSKAFTSTGQVTPIYIDDGTKGIKDTKGFGRFHTISQAGIHFICAGEAAGQRTIEAALLFEPFSPSFGWYRLSEDLCFEVKVLRPVTLDGQDLVFPPKTVRTLRGAINSGWHNPSRECGGPGGVRGPILGFGAGSYAFLSRANPRVKVPTAKESMAFGGADLEINIYSGKGVDIASLDSAKLVQTMKVTIPEGSFPVPKPVTTGTAPYRGTGATTAAQWTTLAQRYSMAGSTPQVPGEEYTDPTRRWAPEPGPPINPPGFKAGGIFRAEDVVRSVVPAHGDLRLIAATKTIDVSQFVKVRDAEWNSAARFLHVFSSPLGSHSLFGFCNEPGDAAPAPEIPKAAWDDQLIPSRDIRYHYSHLPEIRPGAGKLYNKWNDFDNGFAQTTDGAYINKPDEGNVGTQNSAYAYWSWAYATPNVTLFSPNRLVPSAGMLGSLPTGVKRHNTSQPHAWETLLFRPEPGHPGQEANAPRDHLIMDLFWMPVVEPYAISEPFSTAGKVNLNYELAPFSYIRRSTALHGAMKSEEPLAIPNRASKIYKLWDHETNDWPNYPNSPKNSDPDTRADWPLAYNGKAPFDRMRRPIDVEKTLAQCDERFATGELFRSASQLCELHLVRDGESLDDYKKGAIWPQNLPTGDNTRERPYTNIYGRLTTKSNTFTVHVRAQVLNKARTQNVADWATWQEGRDQELGEYRNSTLVERYIDPADPNLHDFAKEKTALVDHAYKLRVLHTRKFSP